MKFKRKLILFLALIVYLFPVTLTAAERPKVCLTMIVKNESKIIERCLNSTKGVADYVSICDTGSTDNTVQIIEQYLAKNKIPGKVHKHVWQNFGHNRSLSVEAAKETLKEFGVPLENAFLLHLDADMMLEVNPEFSKEPLQDDAYLVCQNNGSIAYFNTRLCRASLPWKCIGVTHEYWGCNLPHKEAKLTSLVIDDRNDGGCKADKFERDIRLLTQGLKDEPDNARYMFYLAQSYKNCGQHIEAIKMFKERIARKGWKEEVWYSMYMMGQSYEAMGLWEKALYWYLEAYQYNPERSETLQEISKHYRFHNEHYLSYLFAKQASRIPYPKEQMLFVSTPVYDYLIDEDLSITAYYTPYPEDGLEASNRLLLKKNVPQHIKEQTFRNIKFYVNQLEDASYEPVDVDLPLIREGLAAHYNPMNPSIRKTKEGYDLICRTVNYMQIDARYFKSYDLLDPDNIIKTRNFLIKYDRDFNKLSQQEIVDEVPRVHHGKQQVLGLEDCRLFELKNAYWFVCTTLDTNPYGEPQVSLGKLSDDRSGPSIQVEKLTPLEGPDLHRCEKNWLPFIKDNELHIIYSYDPFIVLKPNLQNKRCVINSSTQVKNEPQKYDFSRFRGSAAPIEFDNGYLVIIHETIITHNRIYLHRFVFLDRDFNITKVSKPFTYLHQGVEYCCGMTIDHSGKNLIMGIGIEDREAHLCTVPLTTVRAMLEPLSEL